MSRDRPDVVGFVETLRPGAIGPMELRNRVVLPAMDMNLCDDGEITDAEIAHYARRAAGGTGLIITGSGAVAFPLGAQSLRQPGLSDDRFVPGLRRLADAVHAEGARLCIQLTHHGKTARVDIAEGRPVPVPSLPERPLDLSALRDNTPDEVMAIAATTAGKTPEYRVADEDDLAILIDQFAEATRRVRDAGADAVEVHAAHGYVLSTFLSAADNRRTDRWGGSLESRCRLTEEVLAAVRREAGDDLAVLVRVSGEEFGEPGALTTPEAVTAARRFVDAGADAIHVTGWGRNSFRNFTDGPLPDTVGAYRSTAAAVKGAVSVPVIAVGRVLPEVAEEMLTGGECDFVAMGRQLLTDPDIVAKLHAGQRASIRPCINCYVCVEQNFFDESPRCAVNPELNDESRTTSRTGAASTPRRIAVIGGGPAGMEYARLASARGHDVTLHEAAGRLGGTAWFSQLTTPANGPFVEWQTGEVERSGVDVRLGSEATVDDLVADPPDLVVVATGAVRDRPDIPGADLPHVISGDDLRAMLAGGDAPGRPVTQRVALSVARRLSITDDPTRMRELSRWYLPLGQHVVVLGGGLVGLELAEFAAERGRRVTLLEDGPALGLPMASPRRWTAVRRAAEHGVRLHRSATVREITEEHVAFTVDGLEKRATADTVVLAGGVRSSTELADRLAAAGLEVVAIGDAGEVGYIEGAVRSAWDAIDALD